MRKKEIEASPYITAGKTSRKKGAGYIAVTAWRNFGNKRHILLEVYRNDKKCLQVPVVRYVANHDEWGVFYPDNGEWTRERIYKSEPPIWRKKEKWQKDSRDGVALQGKQDMDRIVHFFPKIKVWNQEEWWEYFEKHEDEIKENAARRKRELRYDRLQERIRETPALRGQELLDWAEKKVAMSGHILYYKIHGSRATVCCSSCGGVAHVRWKTGDSYESMFEQHIIRPYKGTAGHCTMCGIFGIYRPQGKERQPREYKMNAFTADKYKDNGVVLRYVNIYKTIGLQTAPGDGGREEMIGAYEQMQGTEIVRTYFIPGQKTQTDYCKYNPYTGEDFWDDCNLYGMNPISTGDAAVHPDTWAALKDTFLQYSAMEEYVRKYGVVDAKEYLSRYIYWPQIEMLVKMKLFGIAKNIARGYCSVVVDEYARQPEDFLGIRKDKMKLLTETEGDIGVLRILQYERERNQCWKAGQVMALAETGADRDGLDRALAVMSLQKLLNTISGYAGCEYGTGCSDAAERIEYTARTYFDYLEMREKLGYDLHNKVYQKPRDITEAHNRMVTESNKKEMDERMLAAERKYPGIKKQYRKLKKKYFYEDDTYLIRPAKSAWEIMMEGRLLHHCVGNDSYLAGHNSGKGIILLLRYRAEPENPYITVEIRDEGIRQWYGAHDKKPDEENMQKWLDNYTALLECRRKGITVQPEQETVQLLAQA